MSDRQLVNVTFEPSGRCIKIPAKTLLTTAMVDAGILLPLDCGGNGTCGHCRVIAHGRMSEPSPGERKFLDENQLNDGWRLACQTRVLGDLKVTIPASSETAESGWQIDDIDLETIKFHKPVISAVACEVPGPSLEDPRSDTGRVLDAIADRHGSLPLKVDHQTAGLVSSGSRHFDWRMNAFLRQDEIVGIGRLGGTPLGIAVDLGSTKLAAYLMDLESGRILAAQGRLNPQISFGADVITRLQRAVSRNDDGRQLTDLVRKAIDSMTRELVKSIGAQRSCICEMSIVGNSVMVHLLLDLPLKHLGAPPFVAAFDRPMAIKARELGFSLAPGAYVYIPPLIGGFVGSDNAAMVLATGMDCTGPCRLGLDIGTNTEVVLSLPSGDKMLLIASAPSGPTFEGAHLSSGMRAIHGAISEVRLQNGRPTCRTIDGSKPAGVCGSGIIDAIAELLREHIIDSYGRLDRSHPQVRTDHNTIRYVLVSGAQSATGDDIVLTQSDIGQVQLAKAAINAASMTLLVNAGMEAADISEVILAGSFGSNIRMESARSIGLIPNIDGISCKQVGNAAGKGARMLLNCNRFRKRVMAIPEKTRYIELTSEPTFNTLFAHSLLFPGPSLKNGG